MCTCVPGIGQPSEIITHVKEVFGELSDDKLLTKCLHEKTLKSDLGMHSTEQYGIEFQNLNLYLKEISFRDATVPSSTLVTWLPSAFMIKWMQKV